MSIPYVYNDGGRAAAGCKGAARDCVVRALAIATGLPYAEAYRVVSDAQYRATGIRSARNGVSTKSAPFKALMAQLGFTWTPTMKPGQGCRVHLRQDELPGGRIIAVLSRHWVAVVDGVVHDTYNPTREGNRCVYGYWTLAPR